MNVRREPDQRQRAAGPWANANLPTRREFLKGLGTGLMVWVVLGRAAGAEENEAAHPVTVRPRAEGDFNAFLIIGEDGRVTCFTGKIEMGQGPVS